MSARGRRSWRDRRILLRLRHLALFALAACASAPPRPPVDELKELHSQLDAQSALVAQQQRRIEELEVKLAALAAKSEPTPAARAPVVQPAPMPVKSEPRPQLKTVKLGEGRRLRRATDRVNPVERAPGLPNSVELREPDEDQLARLEADPLVAREFDADRAWSEAVQKRIRATPRPTMRSISPAWCANHAATAPGRCSCSRACRRSTRRATRWRRRSWRAGGACASSAGARMRKRFCCGCSASTPMRRRRCRVSRCSRTCEAYESKRREPRQLGGPGRSELHPGGGAQRRIEERWRQAERQISRRRGRMKITTMMGTS